MSMSTSKKIMHLHYKIKWFMLFREIIATFSENQIKPPYIFYGQNVEV